MSTSPARTRRKPAAAPAPAVRYDVRMASLGGHRFGVQIRIEALGGGESRLVLPV